MLNQMLPEFSIITKKNTQNIFKYTKNKKKCSKLIFGNYIDKADIIVKQNIMYNFIQENTVGQLTSFASNLLSAVKKNYFFTHF